jgi:P27 family predicted phage terminase small subunit
LGNLFEGAETVTTIPFPRSGRIANTPAAPRHLEKPERELWKKIVVQRDFAEAAPLAVLATALDAHMRARHARETIRRDGEIILDRFGAQKKHPLIDVEATAQAQFSRAMKLLGVLS